MLESVCRGLTDHTRAQQAQGDREVPVLCQLSASPWHAGGPGHGLEALAQIPGGQSLTSKCKFRNIQHVRVEQG